MDYSKLAEQLMKIYTNAPKPRINKKLEDYSRGEMMALNYISSAREKVHPKDISRALDITTARVAAMLNSMEKKGMILRIADENDSRQINIILTEKGTAIVEERNEMMLARLTKILEFLGEEDAVAYVRIQEKLMHAEAFRE